MAPHFNDAYGRVPQALSGTDMNEGDQGKTVKYVVVTPVRDEARNIRATIDCVANQTIRPAEWVIVDDGSTDGTSEIIDNAAKEHGWIVALHKPDRGYRKNGSGVMEAFYYGYQSLKTVDWGYIVKLDGDVGLQRDYFEQCFMKFREDPRLGMAGGIMYIDKGGTTEIETQPMFHVRGPIKTYRRDCWNAIGGLIKAPGWDTVDELKANMLGWQTRSFADLLVLHRRPTGDADGGWRNSVKDGIADYVVGYHPLFTLAKCLKRVFQPPILVGSGGLLYGFLGSYLKRVPRVDDPDLVKYVRGQQIRRMLLMESIWK
jgi:poly-beta-1,6-N-acetyl-D-glucosamine synthase